MVGSCRAWGHTGVCSPRTRCRGLCPSSACHKFLSPRPQYVLAPMSAAVGALGARQRVPKAVQKRCVVELSSVSAAVRGGPGSRTLPNAHEGTEGLTVLDFLAFGDTVSAWLCFESRSGSRSRWPRPHRVAPGCPPARQHRSQLTQHGPVVPLQPMSGAAMVCMGQRELGSLGEPKWGGSVVL